MSKEEIIQQIEELKKANAGITAAIEDLTALIQNMPEDDATKMLDFQKGEFIHFVDIDGSVDGEHYNHFYHYGLITNHRAFKSAEMAELFAEKTQFIADALFWKELFDRDYVPDWENVQERKFCVYRRQNGGIYEVTNNTICDNNQIYFSRKEVADNFAEWLNSKKLEEVPF